MEFTLDTLDEPNSRDGAVPGRTVWAFDRHVNDKNTWVMPNFDGWSYVGSHLDGGVMGYGAFRDRVYELERNTSFERKTAKALWRGTVGLGNPDVPSTRQDLVNICKDKTWSDVHGEHFVKQVDHCNWKFLIHTEGKRAIPVSALANMNRLRMEWSSSIFKALQFRHNHTKASPLHCSLLSPPHLGRSRTSKLHNFFHNTWLTFPELCSRCK